MRIFLRGVCGLSGLCSSPLWPLERKWSIAYWIGSGLAVAVQEGKLEGFRWKHLRWLRANSEYLGFFSSFQKVPKQLMYDGHLLSLPSSTFWWGFFFPRAQNWTCQQWAATQLCKECHGWQPHSCRGLGWVFLVKQCHAQEAWCHWDTTGFPNGFTPGKMCQPLLAMLPHVWWL